ncbi:MAG TPA: GNAT family N-acetyltransferase [Actinopolymorphaceae bacterium]
MIEYQWRGAYDDAEPNALHARCFDHEIEEVPWHTRLDRYSLGWVCARDGGDLVGFVNVPWDGGAHAFLLDTMVAPSHRRHGVGVELVAHASAQARAAGCAWLHVDFEPHLRPFYVDGCGFRPTDAGLIRLR